jgi:hypothetical protein
MMSFKLPVFLVLFVFYSQISMAKARIPIPYGTEEKIIKLVELPDTEDFQLEDGTYFDIGSRYVKSHILWLSYSNTEPVIVGYANDGESYLDITPEQLTEIAKMANVEIPTEGSVSFFDKIVGKILLGILVLIILYGLYSKYIKKEED